jgi:hypothetical protein
MHGMGRFTWPDGSVYEGAYIHNMRHGRGTLRESDGTTTLGDWVEGELVRSYS